MKRQMVVQDREKDKLRERVKQDAIQAEVAKNEQRIKDAAEKERAKVHQEASKKVSSKLKKLFGGE
jgi:hypothetical protein